MNACVSVVVVCVHQLEVRRGYRTGVIEGREDAELEVNPKLPTYCIYLEGICCQVREGRIFLLLPTRDCAAITCVVVPH